MKVEKLKSPRINASTKRLVIRPYKATDFKVCQASHTNRHKPRNRFDQPIVTASISDLDKFKSRIKIQKEHAKKGYHYVFGVFLKRTGELVGQIDFFVLNKQMRWANFGYHIQNQYFRQGFGRECALKAIEIAMQQINFYRIEAAIEPENRKSIALARKLPLRFEGKRKNFFPDNGGIDMVVFATNQIDYNKELNLDASSFVYMGL